MGQSGACVKSQIPPGQKLLSCTSDCITSKANRSLLSLFKDYEAASNKAGKVEAEVKRLHNLIVDINSHKLKAQQDKLDEINKELDECSSAITKAQVAIKTAGRYVNIVFAELFGKGLPIILLN